MRELAREIYESFNIKDTLTLRTLIYIIINHNKLKLEPLSNDAIINMFYQICGDIEDCFTFYDYINLLFIIISSVRELDFSVRDIAWLIEDVIYREKSIIKYLIYKDFIGLEDSWDDPDFTLFEYKNNSRVIERLLSAEKTTKFREYYKKIITAEKHLTLLR